MTDGGTHHGQDVAAVVALVVLAGGGAAAATQTDHTAPILAFIGALLVAAIAAVSASRRQAQQLAEERARLAMQLDHDRLLSEVAHLRDLLDTAAALYEEALDAVVELQLAHTVRGVDLGKALGRAARAVQNVGTMHRRLQLRYDDDHPLVMAYHQIHERFDIALTAKPPPDEQVLGDSATLPVISAFRDFSAASRAVIGSDVPART